MFFNICPAKLKFRLFNRDVELSGIPLSLLDIIYHQFPTLFVIYWYLSYYKRNPFGLSFLTALAVIVIYHLIVRDAIDIYGCYDEQKLIVANLVVISLYSTLICVSAPK
jgi:hypothetical protein